MVPGDDCTTVDSSTLPRRDGNGVFEGLVRVEVGTCMALLGGGITGNGGETVAFGFGIEIWCTRVGQDGVKGLFHQLRNRGAHPHRLHDRRVQGGKWGQRWLRAKDGLLHGALGQLLLKLGQLSWEKGIGAKCSGGWFSALAVEFGCTVTGLSTLLDQARLLVRLVARRVSRQFCLPRRTQPGASIIPKLACPPERIEKLADPSKLSPR